MNWGPRPALTGGPPLHPPMRALLPFALLLVAACAEAPEPAPTPVEPVEERAAAGPDRAVAQIDEVDGSGVSGTVEFVDLGGALEVRYNLSGFTSERPRGFHVHETGDCGPDSTGTPAGAAGGHFNPLASDHGAPSASASRRHAGDLGNIVPEANGQAIGTRVDSVLAFTGPTSVIGKAVVVHAGEDDLASQPAGDAGARVGCGVVRDPEGEGPEVDSAGVPQPSVDP